MPKVVLLRLGHRRERDKRVTTHCGLVARAFGASEMILSGEEDPRVLESVREVVKRWGGPFEVRYSPKWKDEIVRWKGIIVHLTMYGQPVQTVIDEIREKFARQDILLVVGAEKVPKELYFMADYNVAITNQPHSEIAAIALFLDKLFEGNELEREFKDWKVKVIPQKRGKKLITAS
jgi:tRNA (cytidine56-2'-O)-methyltransferase